MPFRAGSIDVIVMTSVLEHLLDLETTLETITNLLKKDGILVVGYPVETRVMISLIKILWPESRHWNTWGNASMGMEEFNQNPLTHKQNYTSIRATIYRHFEVIHKEKLLLQSLPDLLSYYELCKLGIKQSK